MLTVYGRAPDQRSPPQCKAIASFSLALYIHSGCRRDDFYVIKGFDGRFRACVPHPVGYEVAELLLTWVLSLHWC